MAPSAVRLITDVRDIQAPLLGVILLTACGTKAARVLRTRSVRTGLGPDGFFPRRLRLPATVLVCGAEAFLGAGLILTAGKAGMRADAIRLAAGLFFLVATCALVELRERRPGVGCGCFGDFSTRPVGLRSIGRAALLTAAALAGVHAPALRLPASASAAMPGLGILLAELLAVTALSPEATEVLVRLGYSQPCELRQVTPQRVLTALGRSTAWRRHARSIISDVPDDMWRELCWWYAVYPARDGDKAYQVIFAVQVKPHRPAIHAAITGWTEPRPRPDDGPVDGEGSPALPFCRFLAISSIRRTNTDKRRERLRSPARAACLRQVARAGTGRSEGR